MNYFFCVFKLFKLFKLFKISILAVGQLAIRMGENPLGNPSGVYYICSVPNSFGWEQDPGSYAIFSKFLYFNLI